MAVIKSTSPNKRSDSTIALPKMCAASVLLSVLSHGLRVEAQTPVTDTTVRMKYVHYRDFQAGGADRMRINSPMLWAKGPLGSSTEFEVGAVADVMSGASPLYLDTLSGASGKGIHDNRYAGDLKITQYFDNVAISAGGFVSEEQDYLSRSAQGEVRVWSDDKNTVFNLGFSHDWDVISSTSNPDLEATRKTVQAIAGVTQVFTPNMIGQSNLMFSSGNGFYNDPYKIFENRPRSRDALAWLNRINYYVEDLDGSIHFDYRLFHDTWDVTSHTLEIRYYQPIGSGITLVPITRYYVQNGASFFLKDVSSLPENQFTTADQRLSDFGGLTLGMKVILQLTDSLSFDSLYQFIQQSSALRGDGADGIKDFGAHYIEVGLAFRY